MNSPFLTSYFNILNLITIIYSITYLHTPLTHKLLHPLLITIRYKYEYLGLGMHNLR